MKATVICAFAGLGKSYLSKKYNYIEDFDIGPFKYKYQNNIKNYECLKATQGRIKNEEYPFNYLKKLKQLLNQKIIILVPADSEIRQLLTEEGIDFIFVIPSLDSKKELIERYKYRGNNDAFIKRAIKDLEDWHKEISLYNYETTVLPKKYYLEDFLLSKGLIK